MLPAMRLLDEQRLQCALQEQQLSHADLASVI